MTRSWLFAFCCAGGLLGCAPHRDYTAEQMAHAPKLSELMDAQATIADPQFKKRDQRTFSDADTTALADVGTRLQASAMHIKDFSKGAEWDAIAVRLHDHAAELVTAAQAKNAGDLRNTLGEIKATCKECHKKFR